MHFMQWLCFIWPTGVQYPDHKRWFAWTDAVTLLCSSRSPFLTWIPNIGQIKETYCICYISYISVKQFLATIILCRNPTFLQDVMECLPFQLRPQNNQNYLTNVIIMWKVDFPKQDFKTILFDVHIPKSKSASHVRRLWRLQTVLFISVSRLGGARSYFMQQRQPMNAHPNHSAPQTAHPGAHIQLLTNFRMIKIKTSADKSLRTKKFWCTINKFKIL